MKVLELFAGSRSIGKVAKKRGHKVFSVDYKKFRGIDLVIDIEQLTPDMIPFVPDMIWASPPCTTYSLAAIGHHRHEGTRLPKTVDAEKGDKLVMNTLKLIDHYKCVYYMENPMATLSKMDFMKQQEYALVWYCRYGDKAAKPTHIFSNNIQSLFNPQGWAPLPKCWNGNKACHHEPAPRGSATGTQGKKNNYERSKIPKRLCIDVIKAAERQLLLKTHLI